MHGFCSPVRGLRPELDGGVEVQRHRERNHWVNAEWDTVHPTLFCRGFPYFGTQPNLQLRPHYVDVSRAVSLPK